jgi:DNA-3-methyladenine glycosylase I
MKQARRCGWVKPNNPLYVEYHDKEWGAPLHDDTRLFEMLCLEGQQTGVTWELVLGKREAYKKSFHNFDLSKCSNLTDEYLNSLLQNTGLIRNKLKLFSIRGNAKAAKPIIVQHKSLDFYLWSFVGFEPIVNNLATFREAPTKTEISEKLSKDLKKRGFKFVGPVVCYAFMQAVGMVDDHENTCFCKKIVSG